MATTTCTLPLAAIDHDACAAQTFDFGQQIRTLFIQDPAGTAPDLLGTKTTPATLSQYQSALSATDAAKVFVIKDIAGGAMPATTDTTISGNDVPGGGTVLVNRTHTFTGFLYLITPGLIDQTNSFILRGGTYRVWFADDKSYPMGPAESATIVFGALERAGIGNASNRIPVTVTFLSKTTPRLGYAPIVGINSLVNV